jgi:hypothetical protein
MNDDCYVTYFFCLVRLLSEILIKKYDSSILGPLSPFVNHTFESAFE